MEESKIVAFLYNNEYNMKIPLFKGINTITTETYEAIGGNNFKSHMILFKLNIQDTNETSLRVYEGFPMLIRVREDCYIEEIFIKKSTIQKIKSANYLEIIMSEKNQLNFNFGSFSVENVEREEEEKSNQEDEKDEVKLMKEVTVQIDLSTDNQTNINHFNETIDLCSNDDLNEEDIIIVTGNLEEKIEIENVFLNDKNKIDYKEILTNTKNKTTNKNVHTEKNSSFNKLVEISEDLNSIFIPKSILTSVLDKIKLIPRRVIGKRKRKEISNSKKINSADHALDPPKSCTICLDTISKPSKVNGCEHIFCQNCIDQWADMSNSCPLCKKEFKKIFYYDDFDKIIKERNVRKKVFRYEEEEENWIENTLEHCMICQKDNDVYLMLVCDKCKFNVCHTFCDGLDKIPDEEWFCVQCVPRKQKSKKNKSCKKRKLDVKENLFKKEKSLSQKNNSMKNIIKNII